MFDLARGRDGAERHCAGDLAADSRLANISTRGFVSNDDNVMIAGVIIGGSRGASSRIVVRTIGPTLAATGIANALADPTLELVDGNGALVRSNDNWREAEAEIQATGLAPRDDRESAPGGSLPPAVMAASLE